MENIVVFNSHTLWPLHYEVELEILQNLMSEGHTVYQIACDAEVGICDLNMSNNPIECIRCVDKRKRGIGLIEGLNRFQVLRYDQLNAEDREMIRNIHFRYETTEEFKALRVENFEIGMAVYSSLVSGYRDSTLDVLKHKTTADRYLAEAVKIYYSTMRVIREKNISRCYVFNGRFAFPRAVYRACQQMNVDCFIHESGGSFRQYELFKNGLPHNISFTQDLIESFWEKGDPEERNRSGARFYEERINGIPQSYFSFIGDQDKTMLPGRWNAARRNIVIFNSSEDEMVAIGDEWKNRIYAHQLEGLTKFIGDLSSVPDADVYLRMHPNLKGVDDGYVRSINALTGKNFERIAPESPVSTYELIRKADVIVSFGSTTGIEAAYMGKVSISLGPSYYQGKQCVYEPKDHKEAVTMALTKDLQPLVSDFPLKYGYYFRNRGIEFLHYQPVKLYQGVFRGFDLHNYRSKKYRILASPVFNNILVSKLFGRFYKNIILPFRSL